MHQCDISNSSVSQDTFIELSEKYEKVETLIEESKGDPETEPYKSKYAALNILKELKSKLVSLIDDVRSTDAAHDLLKAMLGAVWLSLGNVSIETEEFSIGEEYLSHSLKLLEDVSLKPLNILVVLNVLNQLGILWSMRGEHEKSHTYLLQSEQLYKDYQDQTDEIPVEITELFSINNKQPKPQTKWENPIEKVHTLTLYYLAQVYGTLGNPIKSAVYCHTTLRRQLEGKVTDPIEWALNSATLAQFFMEKSAFRLARHLLAAASFVLEQHESSFMTNADYNEEERGAMLERYNHRSADVSRCWAKYGIVLLGSSKDRLMSDDYTETPNVTPAKSNSELSEFSGLQFPFLELSSYEEQVSASHVLMYDDAKLVFLNAQHWLNKAKEYYSLETHATDYAQIIQDWSQLHKNLAFFEDDAAKQCKLHKKRVNLLEELVTALNPNYYLSVCRELWFELGDIYALMLDLKVQRMQDDPERPTPHALKKINFLATKAICSYDNFLDLLRDVKTKEMPKKFSSDLEHAALITNFYMGRLHSKLVSPDKAIQLQNTKKSYEHYKMVVDYCVENETAKQHVGTEHSVCVEMVKLLPLKILKLGSVL